MAFVFVYFIFMFKLLMKWFTFELCVDSFKNILQIPEILLRFAFVYYFCLHFPDLNLFHMYVLPLCMAGRLRRLLRRRLWRLWRLRGGGHTWWAAHLGRRTQDGRTALMFAAMEGHADCARLLLDAGADKDAKDIVRASAGVACGALGEGEVVAIDWSVRRRVICWYVFRF